MFYFIQKIYCDSAFQASISFTSYFCLKKITELKTLTIVKLGIVHDKLVINFNNKQQMVVFNLISYDVYSDMTFFKLILLNVSLF